jgi:hypothetical protein
MTMSKKRPSPDAILALTVLLRHTDRLLIEAEALRQARDDLQRELNRFEEDDESRPAAPAAD